MEYKHASLSNVLLRGAYDLDTVERRIILLALSNLNSSIDKGIQASEYYNIKVEDYSLLCGVVHKDAYFILKRAMDKLLTKTVTVESQTSKTGKRKFHWIQEIYYDPVSLELKLRWSEQIIPYISELKDNFTRLFNRTAVPLQGKYSFRLYVLLEQFRFRGLRNKVEYRLDDLYSSWQISDSLQVYGSFKKHALLPAIEELRKRQLIDIELEEIKEGKKVVGVRFIYSLEKNTQLEINKLTTMRTNNEQITKANSI